LILKGSEAIRISDISKGIKYIANMLNITRIHNTISSISFMRRIITLVYDYSERRVAFGKKIIDH
jgi:alkylation response protein AidB-like acyl-CoA dehydrogenase